MIDKVIESTKPFVETKFKLKDGEGDLIKNYLQSKRFIRSSKSLVKIEKKIYSVSKTSKPKHKWSFRLK
jgi:hypothetical protein